MSSGSVETFAALETLAFCRHAFLRRIPGIDVQVDRAEALARLQARHEALQRELGFGTGPVARAEQIHGGRVAIVKAAPASPVPGTDGLITNTPGLAIGIYVADCCAIYLVDPVRRALGLVHSGRKGTEIGIVNVAIEAMARAFGSDPGDLHVQLSPCIRPPQFEVDFAAQIVAQCRGAGVTQIHDAGANTAAELDRYYSYRMERGRTGRMLALLALRTPNEPGDSQP